MNAGLFIYRVELFVSLAVLIWFFYGPWQRLMVDVARQSLFEIRDVLFLMAADGQLNFNSEQYREVRENFNRSIRFAHLTTFRRVVAGIIFLKPDPSPTTAFSKVIARIPDADVRRSIELKWRRSTRILTLTVLLRSPSMMLLAGATFPLIIIAYILDPQRIQAVDHSIERSIERDMSLQPSLATAA